MPRQTQLRVAYNPAFKKQSAFQTEIPQAQLTAVLQLTSRNHIEVDEAIDPILDCSGQYLINEEVLTRLGRLPLEFDADANLLGGMFALALGVAAAPSGAGPYTHNLSLLDTQTYQGPVTTFGVGFDGVANSFRLFKSAALNRLRVTARGRERVRISAEFVGNGERPVMAAFTAPACSDITPIKLKDGLLDINSVSYLNLTREVEFEFSNNLLTGDDPYTLAGVEPQRLERADLRTMQIKAKVEGTVGDTLSQLAMANSVVPVTLRFGTATSGLIITIPQCIVKEDTTPQGFDGEAGRTVLNLVLQPKRVSGDAPTPLTAQAVNSTATQYLVAA